MSASVQQVGELAVQSTHVNTIEATLQSLAWHIGRARHPVASTKFSPDSAVFLHILTRIMPNIPVIWVDTGYNTRDSLRFAAHLQSILNLNLKTYRPAVQPLSIPPELGTAAHDAFTQSTKLAPFQQAFNELEPDLWISSLRRFQSQHRATLSSYEVISPGLGKSYPMLEWSIDSVEWYRRENNLPLGPDVYDPTKGLPFRECGLHTKGWCASVNML